MGLEVYDVTASAPNPDFTIGQHLHGRRQILSSVDDITLAQFCVAVDRLRTIEMMVNRDNGYLFDSKLMSTRAGYEKTMWRGCNEFCLSPQARAKFGSLAVGKAKDATDPLAEALST